MSVRYVSTYDNTNLLFIRCCKNDIEIHNYCIFVTLENRPTHRLDQTHKLNEAMLGQQTCHGNVQRLFDCHL